MLFHFKYVNNLLPYALSGILCSYMEKEPTMAAFKIKAVYLI